MLGMGSLGNLADLMRGAQELQKKMAELEERLGGQTVEGRAGGDMVRVVANGRSEVVGIEIDPSLMTAEDREMLQELLVAAANQALARARELSQEEMRKVLGGLSLPPGMLNLPGMAGG